MLLDGQELAPIWTFSAAQVLRYKIFSRNPCSCYIQSTPSPSPGHPMDEAPIVGGGSVLPPAAFLPGAALHWRGQ